MVEAMKVEVRQEGNVTIVAPFGPLVIGKVERLMNDTIARLIVDRKVHLLIDLGAVPKMDSSGVDSLVVTCRRAREQGGDAKLARVAPRVQHLLEITQLTSVFEIYPDIATAVASFPASAD
jgi:anti-sigma B factor antagonist